MIGSEQLLDEAVKSIYKLIENNSSTIFDSISPVLLNNKEVVLKLIPASFTVYENLSKELRADREVALASIKAYPYNIRMMKNLADDEELIKEAIKVNGELLEHASKRLQNKEDLVRAAVKKSGKALQYGSRILKNNKDLVLDAVKSDGLSLAYASKILQNDMDIVKAAVRQNGLALYYASKDLANNKKIVLAALKTGCPVLTMASPELRKELDIIVSALYYSKENKSAVSYACRANPAVKFMLNLKDSIPVKQWPFIRKALMEHTDKFLNPPTIIQELTANDPNKYLIWAENALNRKSLSELENYIDTDIEF